MRIVIFSDLQPSAGHGQKKNLTLTEKIRFMSRKTTQGKPMEFLLDQAKRRGSAAFTIPYDRQALADYLGVERSAMSAEIGKLKKAGRGA